MPKPFPNSWVRRCVPGYLWRGTPFRVFSAFASRNGVPGYLWRGTLFRVFPLLLPGTEFRATCGAELRFAFFPLLLAGTEFRATTAILLVLPTPGILEHYLPRTLPRARSFICSATVIRLYLKLRDEGALAVSPPLVPKSQAPWPRKRHNVCSKSIKIMPGLGEAQRL